MKLPGSDRKDLAVQALARSETVNDLAARHGVGRKFVYRQADKARVALDDAFPLATPDSEVLFGLAVTRAWQRQVIVGLTLACGQVLTGTYNSRVGLRFLHRTGRDLSLVGDGHTTSMPSECVYPVNAVRCEIRHRRSRSASCIHCMQ